MTSSNDSSNAIVREGNRLSKKALAISRRSYYASIISLVLATVISLGAALFSYQQAAAARDQVAIARDQVRIAQAANDEVLASQARQVFIDTPEQRDDGTFLFYLVNKNDQPLTNVWHKYEILMEK